MDWRMSAREWASKREKETKTPKRREFKRWINYWMGKTPSVWGTWIDQSSMLAINVQAISLWFRSKYNFFFFFSTFHILFLDKQITWIWKEDEWLNETKIRPQLFAMQISAQNKLTGILMGTSQKQHILSSQVIIKQLCPFFLYFFTFYADFQAKTFPRFSRSEKSHRV